VGRDQDTGSKHPTDLAAAQSGRKQLASADDARLTTGRLCPMHRQMMPDSFNLAEPSSTGSLLVS
jgi:hypothetical protein